LLPWEYFKQTDAANQGKRRMERGVIPVVRSIVFTQLLKACFLTMPDTAAAFFCLQIDCHRKQAVSQ
jgi:hypothetical protein